MAQRGMTNRKPTTTRDSQATGGGLLRITTARIVSQVFFFAGFLGLFAAATYALIDSRPALVHWISKYLEVDPLVGVSTALSTRTIYSGLVFSLITIVLTVLLGRVFCNWVCPFGALIHFVGWAFGKHSLKRRIEVNRYRPMYAVKYMILIGMLVAAVFGSLQIGLLDPIATIHRKLHGRGDAGPAEQRPRTIRRRAPVRGRLGDRHHAAGAGGIERGDPTVLLPGALSLGGIAGRTEPVQPVAHSTRYGQVHQLWPVPDALRRGVFA